MLYGSGCSHKDIYPLLLQAHLWPRQDHEIPYIRSPRPFLGLGRRILLHYRISVPPD